MNHYEIQSSQETNLIEPDTLNSNLDLDQLKSRLRQGYRLEVYPPNAPTDQKEFLDETQTQKLIWVLDLYAGQQLDVNSDFLDVSQAAHLEDVTPRTIRRIASSGHVRTKRIIAPYTSKDGQTRRVEKLLVSKADLQDYRENRDRGGRPPKRITLDE